MESQYLQVSLWRNNVFLITIGGSVTDDSLPVLREEVVRASEFIRTESEKALRPFFALVDLTTLSPDYAAEAILLLVEFEKNNRPYIKKTACWGATAKIRFAAEIVSALSNRDNISFFPTKDKAVSFLEESESLTN